MGGRPHVVASRARRMTTPLPEEMSRGTSLPMTAERWRTVDAILQGALACESARRDAFIAQACGPDHELRHEVLSLLAAHDRSADGFLERPAAEAIGALIAQPPVS